MIIIIIIIIKVQCLVCYTCTIDRKHIMLRFHFVIIFFSCSAGVFGMLSCIRHAATANKVCYPQNCCSYV